MTDPSYDPDFYSFFFPYESNPSPESLRALLIEGFDKIWSPSIDGKDNEVLYHGPANDYGLHRYPLDTSIDYFLGKDDGSITVFDDCLDLSLSRAATVVDRDQSEVSGFRITFEHVHFKRAFRKNSYEVNKPLLESAEFIFNRLPTPFAFSRIPNDLEYETTIKREHIAGPRLPDVYWLTLLSEELCEDIGYSRLETAPVWRAEPLENGGFGLIVTEHPYDYDRDAKSRVRDHLELNNQ